MESNEQNNISEGVQIILKSIALILIFIMFISFNIYKCKKNIFCNMGNSQLVFSEIKENEERVEESTADVFKEIASNKLNIKINGYEVSSIDRLLLDNKSIDLKYLIIKDICLNYIKELGFNIENISEINILGEIEDLPCSLNIIDLKQNKEIAREIYEATLINENLLDLQIKVNVVEREEVDEDVVIKQDDSLYIGQNEAIKGEKGECLLYKEITYDGLVKSNEKVVRERLIKSPVDTVIKKGTKNPYYDGVSFLYRPTSGGYMTSIFGEERVNSYHKGIDIAKDMGEDVIAAFDGEIKSAGYNDGGYGNLIIIEHEGNMETYYAHLSEIYVSEGDIVKKGDIIGAIGSTGYSTGPHLHFELRVNGEPVNPEPYIE